MTDDCVLTFMLSNHFDVFGLLRGIFGVPTVLEVTKLCNDIIVMWSYICKK